MKLLVGDLARAVAATSESLGHGVQSIMRQSIPISPEIHYTRDTWKVPPDREAEDGILEAGSPFSGSWRQHPRDRLWLAVLFNHLS